MRKSILFAAILFLAGPLQAMAQPADFGDYTSQTLISKAWAASASNNVGLVEVYINKMVELYAGKAKDMQASLKEYPYGSKKEITSYWALNDVGTGLFILGEAYRNAGRKDEARKAYSQVVNDYFYAQCWDIKGWFWETGGSCSKEIG